MVLYISSIKTLRIKKKKLLESQKIQEVGIPAEIYMNR